MNRLLVPIISEMNLEYIFHLDSLQKNLLLGSHIEGYVWKSSNRAYAYRGGSLLNQKLLGQEALLIVSWQLLCNVLLCFNAFRSVFPEHSRHPSHHSSRDSSPGKSSCPSVHFRHSACYPQSRGNRRTIAGDKTRNRRNLQNNLQF